MSAPTIPILTACTVHQNNAGAAEGEGEKKESSEESGSGVTVVSKAGTVFEDVHLDEDWYEYCEKGGEAVSATDVEFDFRIEKSGK